jgi:hypothetical protein
MLRLLQRLFPERRPPSDAYYCVLRFPDSTEGRWFGQLPTRGMRMRSHGYAFYRGQLWVVDEVLQSGRNTYTVFLVGRSEYLERLRRSSLYPDLGEELLELARHAASTVKEQRRRWRYRNHQL